MALSASGNVATHERVMQMRLPGTVRILGFDPEGRRLAIALEEPQGSLHAVRILAVQPDDLLAAAADRVTRGLTPEECRTYLQSECR